MTKHWPMIFAILALCFSAVSLSAAGEPPAAKTQRLVKQAAGLVREKGEAVFPEFRKKGSPWLQGDQYIFIVDEKGLELVCGACAELEGKNLWDHKDPTGLYVIREEVALVKKQGAGWLTAVWERPSDKKPMTCRSFVKGVNIGGKLLIVGSSFFLDQATMKKPSETDVKPAAVH